MFKTLSLLTLIVCTLSFSIFNNVCFAGTENADYVIHKEGQLTIRYQDLNDKERALIAVRTLLGDLNSDWDDEIADMASNEEVALITGVGAVISLLVAASSGGSLAPGLFAAWVSEYKSKKARTHRVASADYLTAMSETLSQLDTALAAIETSYTLYAQQHDTYLGVMATHLGRIKATLAMASSSGQTSFTHINYSGTPHTVFKLWGKDNWDMDDLPKDYPCKSRNPCMYSFRTPYEAFTAHQWTCGEDFSIVAHNIPGCGRKYYKCPGYDIPDYHNTFKCTNIVSLRSHDLCGTRFRRCTNPNGCTLRLSHNNRIVTDTDTSPGNFRQMEVTETAIQYSCGIEGHSGVASNASEHAAAGCNTPGHFICDGIDHSPSSCGHIDHFNCDGKNHVEEQCTSTNANGVRCTYKFWRCVHPDVPSYGPSHTHTYPEAPTVPDRPGSFSLKPGYLSIQLRWTSASDGGSPITAYEYQYKSSTNGRRSWSAWSAWTSGGTDNFALITGLNRSTDYAVRMRVRNNEGVSSVTGILITRTKD